MIGDRIVHNDKLAWSPPEGTLVPVHEARQILHDVCWQAAAISKYDCLSRLVPRVCALIRGQDLVEERFVAVC